MEIKDSEFGNSLVNEIRVLPKVISPGYCIYPKQPINCGTPKRKKLKNQEIIFLFLSLLEASTQKIKHSGLSKLKVDHDTSLAQDIIISYHTQNKTQFSLFYIMWHLQLSLPSRTTLELLHLFPLPGTFFPQVACFFL